MAMQTVSAKKGDVEVTITFDFGSDYQEMCDRFGEKVVFDAAESQLKVGLQAAMRRLAEKGLTPEQIQEELANWKPGMRSSVAVDPVQALTAKIATGGLSDDERAALLAALGA